jgi:RNA polymerase sigma-70 factor (ECF subfamily)
MVLEQVAPMADVVPHTDDAPADAGPPPEAPFATEEALLERYLGGDDAAFEQLVEQTGERLFAFIGRFLGDWHEAEDVYQLVWVKVARRAGSFDGRSRFTTWLFQVARNSCLDAVRRRKRRRLVTLAPREEETRPEPFDALAAEEAAPGDTVLDEELGARIREAVRSLPSEQREVFLLKEEADMTFEEIGALLGCGKETAKSRMRYALRRLRNALGAEARQYGIAGADE